MLPGVRGYVLAGGKSSRMQRADLPADKAMLVLHGMTLLDRATWTLQQVCESSRVLCGNAERCARMQAGAIAVHDRIQEQGPLGALEAALADAAVAAVPWVLLLPVDLPYLTADVLLAFGRAAIASRAAAVCMQAAGAVQPLPALVATSAGLLVGTRLHHGDRKLVPALQAIAQSCTPDVGFQPISAEDLLTAGDSSRWFWNLNTPRDLEEAALRETLAGPLHHSTHGGE